MNVDFIRRTMIRCGLVLISLPLSAAVYAQSSANMETTLKEVLAARPAYDAAKQQQLSGLRRNRSAVNDALPAYLANEQLANAYTRFKADSAAWYLEQNLMLARDLHRNDLVNHTAIRLADRYAVLSKFREAQQLLNSIHPAELTVNERAVYYRVYSKYLNYYSINDADRYAAEIAHYRDLALSLEDTASLTYRLGLAEKLLDEKDFSSATVHLLDLLKEIRPADESYARVTYLLGNLYVRLHDMRNAKKYFTLSAIWDLTNAIKDNASVHKLATIYFYRDGDLDMANELTQCALEDAVFSNVHFRMFQVAKFVEEVTNAYQEKEHRQKRQLLLLLGIISLLTLLAGFAAVVIWRQKKRAVLAGKEMALLNRQLAESNRIRQAYISNFFEWCSAYIDKISDYRKKLLKKAINKQGDELITVLKSDALEKQELTELYQTFDTVILSIYPDFITEFHTLLKPGETVTPKQGELLPPMLRVFALIRLGITDSANIAAFLRYSPSTVYNFRTKGRNMAAGNRDEFETAVMQIGELSDGR